MNNALRTKINNLMLKNPVMVASGTFGYGEEFHDMYDISRLGAVITKGISLKPREGNPMPRTVETSSGMLNSIGLANVGIGAFLDEKLPFLSSMGATIIVNIFGSVMDEYGELAGRLDGARDVSAVEINISCPNVKAGGLQFGSDVKSASKVTKMVRDEFSRSVIVKLSPQLPGIVEIAKAVQGAGADALTIINAVPGMAIDIASRRPVLGNISGGLSGPAIRPIAIKCVYDVAGAVKIPIIGCGGIMDAEDALEFIMAGATAIQVGTANFVNPMAALEIIDGLRDYCGANKLSSIKEIVGAARLS